MPIVLHPNANYEVVLSTDAELPKENQPVFIFKYLTDLDWDKIAKLSDEYDATPSGPRMLAIAIEVIRTALIGWRKMIALDGKEISYNQDKLKELLTIHETVELMRAVVSQTPSLEDKKKLDSPSPLPTAGSAKTARD